MNIINKVRLKKTSPCHDNIGVLKGNTPFK